MNNVSFTITDKHNNTSVLTYEGLYARTMFINFYCGIHGYTGVNNGSLMAIADKIFDKLRRNNGVYVSDDGLSVMMLNLDSE